MASELEVADQSRFQLVDPTAIRSRAFIRTEPEDPDLAELVESVKTVGVAVSGLKEQLDEIDNATREKQTRDGLGAFYLFALDNEDGQWQKGRAVAGGNTEINPPVWRELERETGRDHKDLKRWFELYQKWQDHDRFLKEYAEPKAKRWAERRMRALLGAPRLVGEVTMPPGKYTVIYADPPWEYAFSRSDSRSIGAHYPTMTIEQIKAVPVPTAEDAVLFLWATAPKLDAALEVLLAWDFTYRTDCVWDKGKLGMGYWFRVQHEHLLVGTRGNAPAPNPKARFCSVILQPREREHSHKPAIFYQMIETMFPNQTYIELFLRGPPRRGWVGWGNELEEE